MMGKAYHRGLSRRTNGLRRPRGARPGANVDASSPVRLRDGYDTKENAHLQNGRLYWLKFWRRGSGSNRRIKVLQTSQGDLCGFVPDPFPLQIQWVTSLSLQPIQACLNGHPLHFPLQSLHWLSIITAGKDAGLG